MIQRILDLAHSSGSGPAADREAGVDIVMDHPYLVVQEQKAACSEAEHTPA